MKEPNGGATRISAGVEKRANHAENSSPATAGLETEEGIIPRRSYLKCDPAAKQRSIISDGVKGVLT